MEVINYYITVTFCIFHHFPFGRRIFASKSPKDSKCLILDGNFSPTGTERREASHDEWILILQALRNVKKNITPLSSLAKQKKSKKCHDYVHEGYMQAKIYLFINLHFKHFDYCRPAEEFQILQIIKIQSVPSFFQPFCFLHKKTITSRD